MPIKVVQANMNGLARITVIKGSFRPWLNKDVVRALIFPCRDVILSPYICDFLVMFLIFEPTILHPTLMNSEWLVHRRFMFRGVYTSHD